MNRRQMMFAALAGVGGTMGARLLDFVPEEKRYPETTVTTMDPNYPYGTTTTPDPFTRLRQITYVWNEKTMQWDFSSSVWI
jgi:hypothetical protein